MRDEEKSGVVSEGVLVLSDVLVVGVKEDAVGSRESDMMGMWKLLPEGFEKVTDVA